MVEQLCMQRKRESLKGSETRAYDVLTAIFERYSTSSRTLSIEILPSHVPLSEGELYLEDEEDASVGIPKKVLVAAFLTARTIFSGRQKAELDAEMILPATNIILLFDPEYITAANYRKRHLQCKQRESCAEFAAAVELEMKFLDCILTSPLHRQSKSPTLWYHRLWVRRLYTTAVFPDDERATMTAELAIVLRAAEKHQHNYYAFQYARRLYDRLIHPQALFEGSTSGAVQQELVDVVLHWCRAHPADTSGWSFLLFLLQKARDSSVDAPSLEVMAALVSFVTKLQWQGEALWAFLRTIQTQPADFLAKEMSFQATEAIEELSATLSPFHASTIHS